MINLLELLALPNMMSYVVTLNVRFQSLTKSIKASEAANARTLDPLVKNLYKMVPSTLVTFLVAIGFHTCSSSSVSNAANQLDIWCGADGQNFAQPSNSCFYTKNISAVPLYRLVNHYADSMAANEPKSGMFSNECCSYHMHVHFAWRQADVRLSRVALALQNNRWKIVGSNLVSSIGTLIELPAKGTIGELLDFLFGCYCFAVPQSTIVGDATVYVSNFRSSRSSTIDQALLTETTQNFLKLAAPGSYYLAWSDAPEMVRVFTALKYEQLICGDTPMGKNPCHWSRVGMDDEEAKSRCLYRIQKI
ncbi:hypothetical protein X801_02182, partial [Opisthorchis viverrini]